MIFIISAPSGCGKSTLAKHLLENFNNLKLSISVTTRAIRPSEIDGVNYYFKTVEEYQKIAANNEFFETVEFCGNYYGTLKSEIKRIESMGANILLEIDTIGAVEIINKYKNSEFELHSLFILPPSIDILRQRLRHRGENSESEIEGRISEAQREISFANSYDQKIINDDLDVAKREIGDWYLSLQKS